MIYTDQESWPGQSTRREDDATFIAELQKSFYFGFGFLVLQQLAEKANA